MTRSLVLAAAFLSAMLPLAAQAKGEEHKQVTVFGRTWIVGPADEAPGRYRATRLNPELDPFRPPAMLDVRQAVRAYKAATGCSANIDTIFRSISGSYYAVLICPPK